MFTVRVRLPLKEYNRLVGLAFRYRLSVIDFLCILINSVDVDKLDQAINKHFESMR